MNSLLVLTACIGVGVTLLAIYVLTRPPVVTRCDRCGRIVCLGTFTPGSHGAMTAGFYNVQEPSGWACYSRPRKYVWQGTELCTTEREHVLCDCCMWCDSKYIRLHGKIEHTIISVEESDAVFMKAHIQMLAVGAGAV